MGWYKLVFKQNQPIHIGSAKWGVIKETGIFITGQTMWGALVNTYILQNQINSKDEIKNIGGFFEKTTNFFPSLDGENILKPKYGDGKFYLDDISEEKFRFYFIDTVMQTAIEPISRQAKDESLHEFDFLLPKPKGKLKNFRDYLYWIGLVLISEEDFLKYIDADKKKKRNFESIFKEIFKHIYVGGDVKYGFGELELVKIIEANGEVLKDWQIDTDGEKICLQKDTFSLYFIEADLINEFEGELQLIPELDFTQNIPMIEEAKFFISVGSKLNENKEFELKQLKKGKIYAQNL